MGLAECLHWPDRLNPFEVSADFAYGHLPLYLLALARLLAPSADSLLVGRVLAALCDLGTVALTFVLGRQLYADGGDSEGRTGLLAAAFVALMVLHVQQSHFYTADVLLTLFVLVTLFFAARLAGHGGSCDAWLAGLSLGLALGSKFSALLLGLPVGMACLIAPGERRAKYRHGLESVIGMLVAFGLTNPFALLAFPTLWHNVAEQAAIARGVLDVPYTRQFHATWPYLYPIEQQLRWGMGLPLGLVSFGGFIYAIWRAVRESPRRAEWVVLSWSVPAFAFTGALRAKFPRYLLPITPLLALCAARMLADLGHRRRRTASWLALSILAGSFVHCLVFIGLYRSPHPWVDASEWFYTHVPQGATIAVERWDHPLPLDAAGYYVRELPVFDAETPEKMVRIRDVLAESDYVVIASQRAYATLARWPARYPLTSRYYHQLFEGQLDFEPVACFGRYPRLGPLALVDDPTAGLDFSLPELCRSDVPFALHLGRLDESFVVYDHPRVMIWQQKP